MTAKTYRMIRGEVAEARCANKGEFGSPLYCECGCQEPRPDDPEINLDGVRVARKSPQGYANYILTRNGVECGMLNTQHSYIYIDGHEFLGVDDAILKGLFEAAWALPTVDHDVSPGETLEEAAAKVAAAEASSVAEEDRRNRNHPGYCPKCHSFCYGDCEAN